MQRRIVATYLLSLLFLLAAFVATAFEVVTIKRIGRQRSLTPASHVASKTAIAPFGPCRQCCSRTPRSTWRQGNHEILPQVKMASLPFADIVSDLSNNIALENLLSFQDAATGKVDTVKAGAVGVLGLLAATNILPSLFPPSSLLDKATLQSIVEGTFLSRSVDKLECVYKASRDGWSAISFHDAVDGKGSAVVVCKKAGSPIFGGFNPAGWRSTDDYYISTAAFLWFASKGTVRKYRVNTGGDAAIFDYATAGPCFGSSDLIIGPSQAAIMGGFAGPDMEDTSKNAGNLRQVRCSPGITYDTDSQWPARGSFGLIELEVYCNP